MADSYIDYDGLLDPSFVAPVFANSLVRATNDASDQQADLATPLARLLFDQQELDERIDRVSRAAALPLLSYSQTRADAARRVDVALGDELQKLVARQTRLQADVVVRYEAAAELHLVADRLCQTLGLARALSRAVMLARQLEAQMGQLGKKTGETVEAGSGEEPAKRGGLTRADEAGLLVRAARSLVGLRALWTASRPEDEGYGLAQVKLMDTLRTGLVLPAENRVLTDAQRLVRDFSIASGRDQGDTEWAVDGQRAVSVPSVTRSSQADDVRTTTTAALTVLCLLSPPRVNSTAVEHRLALTALQKQLQSSVQSSTNAVAKALANLATLERTMQEVSARCQDTVALEHLLRSMPAVEPTDGGSGNSTTSLLPSLLSLLDAGSLASYFWRSLAAALSPRVQEILSRGGAAARTLRMNRDRIREATRQCVDHGSRLPDGLVGSSWTRVDPSGGTVSPDRAMAGWEREAAVMVGAVIGPLNR